VSSLSAYHKPVLPSIDDLICCPDSFEFPDFCSMHVIRDASKDKPFELEMGWLCEETNMKFSLVPKALL
jgi:hypothetical protein